MKNIKNYLPDLNTEHKFDKISDDISIYRDEFGIPHIKAKNSFDAFFGQGFATAQAVSYTHLTLPTICSV